MSQPFIQEFPEQLATVRITKPDANGNRFAHVSRPGITVAVPIQMLALAAGKDAWMRKIKFRCMDCGERHPAEDMECELCQKCYAEAEEENARANS